MGMLTSLGTRGLTEGGRRISEDWERWRRTPVQDQSQRQQWEVIKKNPASVYWKRLEAVAPWEPQAPPEPRLWILIIIPI